MTLVLKYPFPYLNDTNASKIVNCTNRMFLIDKYSVQTHAATVWVTFSVIFNYTQTELEYIEVQEQVLNFTGDRLIRN